MLDSASYPLLIPKEQKEKLQLREYQENAINALFNFFDYQPGNPLVVIPTGGGKSLIIGEFIRRVFERFPNQRISMLAHRKELIEQNADELLGIWPQAPVGVYSAGLKKRQLGERITIAGIQSVHDKAMYVGHSDLLIIDECHLLPKSGMGQYNRFINDQKNINPYVRTIGFTATPYRFDSGLLIDGKDRLFTDIVYEISIRALIDMGYLTPLISRPTDIHANLANVKVRGDYVQDQLESAMTEGDLVERTVADIIRNAHDRKSWIIFCTGKRHVDMVMYELQRQNISCVSVTEETTSTDRRNNLEAFKHRKVRAIVNCNVLTTGFNAKNIDLVVDLAPTMSTSLYVQKIGRGTRLFNGKINCLILDYAGNINQHGPVDQIHIKKKMNYRTGEMELNLEKEVSTKICDSCGCICGSRVQECEHCGFQFPIELKHTDRPHDVDILSQPEPPKWITVSDVEYARHTKKGGIDSLKVTYHGWESEGDNIPGMYKEWVCINHQGFARDKAVKWVGARLRADCDISEFAGLIERFSIDDAVARPHDLLVPKRINVQKDGNFWSIKEYEF